MKILYHHRTLSKDGQDVHIQEMIAALTRRGHEVIVVAPPTSRHGNDGRDDSSSRLRALLPRGIAELLELAYSIPVYWRLFKAWREHRPDVLYERYNLFLLSGIWLKKHTRIPTLLEVNAPLYEERRLHSGLRWTALARWAERFVWRHSDAVLPVTSVLAKHVLAVGVQHERIHVIANGVDSNRFFPELSGAAVRLKLKLDDKLVLGFTGFVRPWHGLVRVVEMMAALHDHPELHFLVVGDGPGLAEIEKRAWVLGVADRVTIVGVVGRDAVASYIAAFDIALQPHAVAYASPLKLFEYMALGRVIVAPDQPNIREVLRHEHDALLFDPNDEGSFQAAIMRLCGDPDLRTRLGTEAARTLEHGRYSWDDNAEKIEEIAQNLLNSDRSGPVKLHQAVFSSNAAEKNA